jgi:hypothetical protein
MQIDQDGARHWFPLLPRIDGEPYEQWLERSRKAYVEQKDRDRDAAERAHAAASGVRTRTPLGHSGSVGHPRTRIDRPPTAGRW